MNSYDLIVIGGGVSGLMAAIEAKTRGINNVIIIEREDETGGAINACVHTGFFYKNIRENLTAPELISRLTKEALELGVIIKCNTTAIEIKNDNEITIVNSIDGLKLIRAKSIILAMGSREKPFGYKNILGYGAMSGLVTSRATLNYINNKGVLPGKQCIILGSDDIGILTAKTLILEGAHVKCVIETGSKLKAQSDESKEDIIDFNIPVMYSHRVIRVYGKSRVTGVDIVKIDNNYNIIEDSKEYMDCDTLILCMKLKPDSELAEKYGIEVNEDNDGIRVSSDYESSKLGIFACGTVTSGFNSAYKSMAEGRTAGKNSANYIFNL